MIQIPPPMTRPVLFAVIPARVHHPAIIFYFYRPGLASSGCLLQSAGKNPNSNHRGRRRRANDPDPPSHDTAGLRSGFEPAAN